MWSEIKGQLVSADVASQHWRLICDCMDWHVKQQGIEQNWSLQWSHHWEQYTKLRFLYSLSATYADFSNQVCKYALDLSIDTIYAYDLRSSREKEKKNHDKPIPIAIIAENITRGILSLLWWREIRIMLDFWTPTELWRDAKLANQIAPAHVESSQSTQSTHVSTLWAVWCVEL